MHAKSFFKAKNIEHHLSNGWCTQKIRIVYFLSYVKNTLKYKKTIHQTVLIFPLEMYTILLDLTP